jgi:hypothetical protein
LDGRRGDLGEYVGKVYHYSKEKHTVGYVFTRGRFFGNSDQFFDLVSHPAFQDFYFFEYDATLYHRVNKITST